MRLGAYAREFGLYDFVEPIYSAFVRYRWLQQGSQIPAPSAEKRRILAMHGAEHRLRFLVETGTFKADTVRSLRKKFDHIYSIELDDHLYEKALARCRHQANATILHGDSAVLLPRLISTFDCPALFWLDAHHSGPGTAGTDADLPILSEIRLVLEHEEAHVVLIDDMRHFVGGQLGYPSVETIRKLAESCGYQLVTTTDIMVLTPH
jgi:hypothetical protein